MAKQKKQRTPRQKNDFYATPAWMVHSLLKNSYVPVGLITEPCAGNSAIANVLIDSGRLVEQHDKDPQFGHFVSDARTLRYAGLSSAVITNPPYTHAFEIVKNAVEQKKWCAFLLRISFLEPTKKDPRGEWLEKNPPTRIIVQPRHAFSGKNSDMATVAWMIWDGRSSDIVIDLQSWKDR
jgi:hypothetical protein